MPEAPSTRFVLVDVSHAGNVGAAARAIKVMGFHDLVLVAPRHAGVLEQPQARAMASGALDVLDRARVVPGLADALTGAQFVCATAMTPRDFGPPVFAPRERLPALAHWQEVLQAIGFLDPATPKRLMPRLNQLLNRAQPRREELHILRGIARAAKRHVR